MVIPEGKLVVLDARVDQVPFFGDFELVGGGRAVCLNKKTN